MKNYGQKLQLDHFVRAREVFEEAEAMAKWVKHITVRNQLYQMAADARDIERLCEAFVKTYLTE